MCVRSWDAGGSLQNYSMVPSATGNACIGLFSFS